MVKVHDGVALPIIDGVCFATPAHTIVLQQRLPDDIAKGPRCVEDFAEPQESHGQHSRVAGG